MRDVVGDRARPSRSANEVCFNRAAGIAFVTDSGGFAATIDVIESHANRLPLRDPLALFPIGDHRALGVKATDRIALLGFPLSGGQSMTALAGTVNCFSAEFGVLVLLSAEGRHEGTRSHRGWSLRSLPALHGSRPMRLCLKAFPGRA